MKTKDFDDDFKEANREPIFRKRNKGASYDEDDYVRKKKKSGKRSHRKPTPKDGFGEK